MPSTDRLNIVLPEEDQKLADRIAKKLGVGRGGRSAAIRYALRVAAEKLGVADEKPAPKKKKPTP